MTPYLLQHYLALQAALTPQATAVEDADKALSYMQLDLGSRKLAAMLVADGLARQAQVGVYLDKSADALLAFFAVLRAQACYVPLDAAHTPAHRVADILELGEVRCLITSTARWQAASASWSDAQQEMFSHVRLVFIDELVFDDASASADPAPDERSIDLDLAYILFTSGSTGRPKGVTISHRNATTFVNWSLSYFNPPPGKRFACHASLNFDLTVFDIYVAIASGGTVVMVPGNVAANPRAMAQWIGESRIDCWYSVPSAWIAVLNHARLDDEALRRCLARLEWVLFAGEVFPPTYLRRLMATAPAARFVNLYGPTETNVCTYFHVPDAAAVGERPVPIGRPCGNTDVVVLTADMREAAVGEEGELMVSGSGVTAGYFRNEAASSAAFMASPLSHHRGRLLYRTGDRVRLNAEGQLDYLGRNDLMVKIAGFRVELQEVEGVLHGFALVRRAVALAYRCERRGNLRLGALIESHEAGGAALSVLALKEFVSKTLPAYMVPEAIFPVGSIPLNPNGKTDRLRAAELLEQLLT